MVKKNSENNIRLRRSLLSVPAINSKAIAKLSSLSCDGAIFDLEDSVAPEKRAEARKNLASFFKHDRPLDKELIIRINPLSSDDGMKDLALALQCEPDAILLPKVDAPSDIHDLADLLFDEDAPDEMSIWAMIETPRGVLNVANVAEAASTSGSRLSAFVLGLNDLRKETRVPYLVGRSNLSPWMSQVVLAARAYGMDVIDSVYNDFSNVEALEAEAMHARSFGFDGKMLIHPAQIEVANSVFAPNESEIAEANEIYAAFNASDAKGKNVININGRMVERLHADEAKRILAIADEIKRREA
jgi:citrate lyase subunit beta/citryl-CoA lyase